MKKVAFIISLIGCLMIVVSLVMVNPWLAVTFFGTMVLSLGLLAGWAAIDDEDNHNNSI